MILRSAPLLPALGVWVLLFCGCAGDPPPRTFSAASQERDLDSVIFRCRDELVATPDDAALHARLARSLVDRVMLREINYRNLSWSDPGPYGAALTDITIPLDSFPRVSIPDTLREAESHAARAVALNPGDPDAKRTLGRIYLGLGQSGPSDTMFAKASAQFEAAIALEPRSAESLYGLGCSLFRRNRPADALIALNKSVSIDSSIGSVYLTLGEVYYDTVNIAFAYACYENAARLGLTTAREYLQLAYHYLDDAAERRLLGRIAFLRRDAPAFLKPAIRAVLNAASLYHPAIAMEFASRALEIDSTYADAHILKARLYAEEGDTGSAREEYLEACRLGTAPFFSCVRFPPEIREYALGQLPDNDVSLALFNRPPAPGGSADAIPGWLTEAVRKRPGSALAAYFLGEAYRDRGDTARAIFWFDRVMSLPPIAFPQMYWTIEQTYLQSGLLPRVVLVFDRCLIGREGNWMTTILGDAPATKRHAKKTLRLAESYCAAGLQCSWMILKGPPGYWKGEAMKQFNRAMELVPESPGPYVCLGELYLDIGRTREALRYYRVAASRGSQEAIAVLKREGEKM